MRDKHIPFTTNEEIINHTAVVAHFNSIIDSYNIHFSQVEQIKKITLLPQEWSVDTGELTPKLSLKRKVIMEKHEKDLEGIYLYEK